MGGKFKLLQLADLSRLVFPSIMDTENKVAPNYFQSITIMKCLYLHYFGINVKYITFVSYFDNYILIFLVTDLLCILKRSGRLQECQWDAGMK